MKSLRRLAAMFSALVLIGGWSLLITTTADAHRNGCHSQHSCPSDANPPTYQCGDTGHGCNYPNDPSSANTPHLSGPPTASDCQNHPQYYYPSVCSGAAPRASAAAPSSGGGGSSASGCGVERWPVKTGSDADRGEVSLQSATRTTIAYLTSLSRPSSLPSNGRVAPVETTQWTIDANLVEYKIEADSDVHLVLHDAAGHSMIAEIPSPSCVSSASPMKSAIAAARAAFDARFDPVESWRYTNTHLTITGVGFWDFFHGQTGVAPNAIEIHPVLKMGAGGAQSSGAAVPSAAPQATSTVQPTQSPATTEAPPATPVATGATSASPPLSAAATVGGLVILFGLVGGAGYGIYRLARRLRSR